MSWTEAEARQAEWEDNLVEIVARCLECGAVEERRIDPETGEAYDPCETTVYGQDECGSHEIERVR